MSRTFSLLTSAFLIFLSIAILGGLAWANTLYARDHPGETDFLVPWLAARTFLYYGDNPYSDVAAQRAQVIYYGRLAIEGQDPLRLSIPFPVELFYFPFALISDYALARGLWMTCLEIALVAMAFLSLRLTGWKPARTLLPVFLIFSVLWIYGFLSLAGSRAVIFVALAIVGLLLALREGRDEMVGALLVVPFFKPDIAGLLTLFIIWWAIFHRRGRILAGFLMTLAILLAISFFILSDWFMPFISGLISHINYSPAIMPGAILASCHLLWTASLTLAATPILGIPVILQDNVPLFLPLILFLSILAERWPRPGRWGMAGLGLLVIFFGFWLITASLFLAGAFAALTGVLALVFPIFLVLGLYWMRWWGVRPPRTWSDSLP
ncbi:MAG: hypothetical protein NTV38_11740 [Chloroflexi bacterium]|nr:hypothetical protein [Chloroflexota bacterium]